MEEIVTVRLYHPDGGQIRVNADRADYWKENGWSEERQAGSLSHGKGAKTRANLKAVGKSHGKDGDD